MLSHGSLSRVSNTTTPTVTEHRMVWTVSFYLASSEVSNIYGPTQYPDGTWRIKTHDKLRHRTKEEYIINL